MVDHKYARSVAGMASPSVPTEVIRPRSRLRQHVGVTRSGGAHPGARAVKRLLDFICALLSMTMASTAFGKHSCPSG